MNLQNLMKNNFGKNLVNQDKSILETINSMESHGQQISLIINNRGKLLERLVMETLEELC